MSQTPQALPPPDSTLSLSSLDHYRLVRARVEHEDDLITQRLNWFLASQSFLFSAYAISLNGPDSVRDDLQHRMVLSLVPLMAIAIAILVFLGVVAGLSAMRHLHQWLADHIPPADLKLMPSLQWFTPTQYLGLAAPLALPPLFVIVWVVLMLARRH